MCIIARASEKQIRYAIMLKIGCKQMQLDHMIRVTATSKAILPCNIVFIKISELGIHL